VSVTVSLKLSNWNDTFVQSNSNCVMVCADASVGTPRPINVPIDSSKATLRAMPDKSHLLVVGIGDIAGGFPENALLLP
jgi:hypothetical protein